MDAQRILDAAGVGHGGDDDNADTLAGRVTDAMWWTYSTPIGYFADRATFEDIVHHVARRLRVDDRVDPDAEPFEQAEQLTRALLGAIPRGGVPIDALDADTRRRLGASWLPATALGSAAGSSFAARWGSGKVLSLFDTPIGRFLPYLPTVGPWIGAARTASVAVHAVSGPLGIALAVLTFNQALGANYRKLVPLVLGVGALRPPPINEAEVIEFSRD